MTTGPKLMNGVEKSTCLRRSTFSVMGPAPISAIWENHRSTGHQNLDRSSFSMTCLYSAVSLNELNMILFQCARMNRLIFIFCDI